MSNLTTEEEHTEQLKIYQSTLKKLETIEYNFDANNLIKELENDSRMEYVNWVILNEKRINSSQFTSSNSNRNEGRACDYCRSMGINSLFNNGDKLKKHMEICKYNPNNEFNVFQTYQCQFCSKSSTNMAINIKHENICFENPNNTQLVQNCKCSYCNKIQSNPYNKRVHENICIENPNNTQLVKNYSCQYCNKIHTNGYNKRTHEIACKQNPINIKPVFNCEFCSGKYDSTDLLEKHKSVCLKNPINIELEIQRVKKLTCTGCSAFCKHEKLYDLHIRSCAKYITRLTNSVDISNIDMENITDIELNALVQQTLFNS
jgi:hypothetical protein